MRLRRVPRLRALCRPPRFAWTDPSPVANPGSVPVPRTRRSALAAELDRCAHQGAVLGPRTVVVLDVGVPQQLVQHEPGVAGALTDPAVSDGRCAVVQPGRRVEGTQLVVGLEGAVLV